MGSWPDSPSAQQESASETTLHPKRFPDNSMLLRGTCVQDRQIGEERCCREEEDNAFDRFAVTISKDGRIVGHVTSRTGKNFQTQLGYLPNN